MNRINQKKKKKILKRLFTRLQNTEPIFFFFTRFHQQQQQQQQPLKKRRKKRIPIAMSRNDFFAGTPQWGAADAELKSHLVRTQSLNVLPL